MSECHDCGGPAISVLPAAGASGKSAPTAVIAMIGPPNSGKSTLFNRLTGLRQKVANFPGVTVEQRTGRVKLANDREASAHRSARPLQPGAAFRRRAGHARRSEGPIDPAFPARTLCC